MLKGFLIALLLVPIWLYWDLKLEGQIEQLDWRYLLIYGFCSYLVLKLLANYAKTKSELKEYRSRDLLRQKGWTEEKRQALIEGAMKGHDLERLAETLGHSVASVRGKLVKSGDYDAYLENYVEQGAQKFAEWQNIQIGKVVPLIVVSDAEENDHEESGAKKPNSELVRSLAQNWFDPRIEFCERFYLSAKDQTPDLKTQHNVIRHVAAFLNSAGGYVLIGVGKKGKLLGLLDDDFRTPLHYTHRLSETLRKSLGDASMKFVDVSMVRVSSEDVCLVTCQKSDDVVLCCHRQYNKLTGSSAGQKLQYDRVNAMTTLIEDEPSHSDPCPNDNRSSFTSTLRP